MVKDCTCGHAIGHPLVPRCTCKKKEWVSLTDKEIDEAAWPLFPENILPSVRFVLRHLESILKEKNT